MAIYSNPREFEESKYANDPTRFKRKGFNKFLFGDIDVSSPKEWAQGIGNEALNVGKSFKKTLTGENVINAVNPQSGFSPTQRLAGIGEDALNYMTIIPGAKAVASIPELAMGLFVKNQTRNMAIADAEAASRILPYEGLRSSGPPRPAPTTPVLSQRAQQARQKADLLSDVFDIAVSSRSQPHLIPRAISTIPGISDDIMDLAQKYASRYEVDIAIPETFIEPPSAGTVRMWHTTPTGGPLPPKLSPIGDDIPGRRGPSSGMLLSNGLYNTESGTVSSTYGRTTPVPPYAVTKETTGGYIPRSLPRYMTKVQPVVNSPFNINDYYDPVFNRDLAPFVEKWLGKNPGEIKIKDILNAAPNEQEAWNAISASRAPYFSDEITTLKYPLFSEPGGRSSVIGYGSSKMPSYISPRSLWDEQITSTSRLRSGQNYWDLPIERGPVGEITNVGGMKAYDIGNMGGISRKEIGDSTAEFLRSNNVYESDIDEIVDLLTTNNFGVTQEDALRNWRVAQQKIEDALRYSGNNHMTKDDWYDYLRSDLGAEVFPHPGGATTNNPRHQAFVINSPENLPPSTYVGPPEQASYDANEMLSDIINKYIGQMRRYRRASAVYPSSWSSMPSPKSLAMDAFEKFNPFLSPLALAAPRPRGRTNIS